MYLFLNKCSKVLMGINLKVTEYKAHSKPLEIVKLSAFLYFVKSFRKILSDSPRIHQNNA